MQSKYERTALLTPIDQPKFASSSSDKYVKFEMDQTYTRYTTPIYVHFSNLLTW